MKSFTINFVAAFVLTFSIAWAAWAGEPTKQESGRYGPGQHWFFEKETGVLLATIAPIRSRPVTESMVRDAKARGALGVYVPKARRLRVYWCDRDRGEATLVYSRDVEFPTTYGMQSRSMTVFDASFTDDLLVLVYRNDMSLYAVVHDPGRSGGTMLAETQARDERPEGTYIYSSRIMDWTEREAVVPTAATIEGTRAGDDLKLVVKSEQGDSIVFELKRDGEGYCWFRPKR